MSGVSRSSSRRAVMSCSINSSGFLLTAVRSYKQMPDLVPQRANAPPLHPAHFRVKLPFQPIFDGDQFDKMAPTQLVRQCLRQFCSSGKYLRKTHHLKQIPPTKSPSKFLSQLCRQCLNNLLAILRTLVFQDILANPPSDVPVHHHQSRIDGPGRLFAGGGDQLPHVGQQRGIAQRTRTRSPSCSSSVWFSCCVWPFWTTTSLLSLPRWNIAAKRMLVARNFLLRLAAVLRYQFNGVCRHPRLLCLLTGLERTGNKHPAV